MVNFDAEGSNNTCLVPESDEFDLDESPRLKEIFSTVQQKKTLRPIKQEKTTIGRSGRPRKCALEAKVEVDENDEKSSENDPENAIATLTTVGQMQRAESVACHTAQMVQHANTIGMKSGNECIDLGDSTHDSDISIYKSGSLDESNIDKRKKQPIKRQRKTKADSRVATAQNANVTIKPKRSRSAKSKAAITKIEQPSPSMPPSDGLAGK